MLTASKWTGSSVLDGSRNQPDAGGESREVEFLFPDVVIARQRRAFLVVVDLVVDIVAVRSPRCDLAVVASVCWLPVGTVVLLDLDEDGVAAVRREQFKVDGRNRRDEGPSELIRGLP